MAITYYELILRLLLACIFGGIVGWTRERLHKPAGFRTHVLVSLGSALITIMSIYGFRDFGTGMTSSAAPVYNALPRDPARIAANIVTGIGFLGAGTIMREGSSVTGLTTAASIWVVAGIGMAIGSGMYFSASITAVLAFIVLIGFFEKYIVRNQHHLTIAIAGESSVRVVGEVLQKHSIDIKHVSILPIEDADHISVVFQIRVHKKVELKEAINELEKTAGIISVQDSTSTH